MKRFAALLTAVIFLLGASALAFDGEGYPSWDGTSAPQNSCCGAFGDERISLAFDPSTDYSNVLGGVVQACFFAYDANDQNFLELYLLIPENVAAGDVLRSGDGKDCSIYLYETAIDSETLYFAGVLDATPDGSSFELVVESAEVTDTAIRMSGSLTARLCRYDSNAPQRDFLSIGEAHFDFSLPLEGNPFTPKATDEPEDSVPGLPGAAQFTLPPDYISI